VSCWNEEEIGEKTLETLMTGVMDRQFYYFYYFEHSEHFDCFDYFDHFDYFDQLANFDFGKKTLPKNYQ